MIENIEIQNFKSLQKNAFALAPLTVLAGQNGIGKSSLLQSLLLLRQSKLKGGFDKKEKTLSLNDKYISIGAYQDAIFQDFEREAPFIEINIRFSKSDFTSKTADYYGTGSESSVLPLSLAATSAVWKEALWLPGRFQYLQADRGGLVDEMPANNEDLNNKDFGKDGRGAAHYFLEHRSENIPLKALAHPDEPSIKLEAQLNKWLGEISAGVKTAHKYHDTDATKIIPLFSFPSADGLSKNPFKLKNVGFGISYAFPLILSLLTAQKGDLLLLENPEAHLHPHGQSKMAELIARAAAAGVQIVLETHSDHIGNGIMIANKNGLLEAEKIKMYFFERKDGGQAASVTEIKIKGGGRIQNAPDGFFDQFAKDLRTLMRRDNHAG